MTYVLQDINKEVVRDPKGLIERSEYRYHQEIQQTAQTLIASMKQRPILFINGPSSSGKTTTAGLLCRELEAYSVCAEVISMDDYYRTRSEYVIPKDEEGVDDLESPLCMDLPLLNDHLQQLVNGEEIQVPHFDFEKQSRGLETRSVRLTPGKIVVIEGIHALSDTITGGLDECSSGLYLSVNSEMLLPDGGKLTSAELRFLRRAVRDQNFRAAPIATTLYQWRSIRRGERLYIAPHRHRATLEIDSYLSYETNILAPLVCAELQGWEEILTMAGLCSLPHAAAQFHPLPHDAYLPEHSLLHEFIG